jgi:signal transduction histidine kinase
MEIFRDRSVRFAAGLTIAIAIPVAGLFYFQFRSISALSRSSAVVLRQLSQETADGLTQGMQDALKAPYINVLLRVGQAQSEPLDLGFIATAFEQGLAAEPFVSRFYVWSDNTTLHRDEVLAYDRETHGFTTDAPEGPMIVRRVRELAPQKRAISPFDAIVDGKHVYFQAQVRWQTPSRDKLTSFVALRVDEDRLRDKFLPAFVQSRLKKAEGPTGFPALTVRVLDSAGRVAYPKGAAALPYVDERPFPLVFFDTELAQYTAPEDRKPETWRLRTGYGNQTIPEILASRERPQRAMLGLLAALLTVGVFFVVRAAAREVRVAEMKSTFVSSVSHDLKTPLALIQLFAETLELGRLKSSERAHEYYRIINSEAKKLTRLINNLLDFSKIEAGLRRYKRLPEDLSTLTRRVVESLDSQFRHNQYTVTLHADDKVPVVIGRTGAREPVVERHEVLAGQSRDSRHGRSRRRFRRHSRGRPRNWHSDPVAAQNLPQVFSRTGRRRLGPARYRPWARHRGPRDARPRRIRARAERTGTRQHLFAALPAERRRGPR